MSQPVPMLQFLAPDRLWLLLLIPALVGGYLLLSRRRASRRRGMGRTMFDLQMWQPFRRWVSSAYPQDAAAMFQGNRGAEWKRTQASVRLWEQHTKEYAGAGSSYFDRV